MTDVKQKHIVCLIDDDNIYQYTARVILESTGLARQIHSFYDGKEALNYFLEQLPANAEARARCERIGAIKPTQGCANP